MKISSIKHQYILNSYRSYNVSLRSSHIQIYDSNIILLQKVLLTKSCFLNENEKKIVTHKENKHNTYTIVV